MFREPKWSTQVKLRDNYTCKICGEGTFDHVIVEAHHKKRKADYPELADQVENGETVCMWCHSKEHFLRGQYYSCALILLRLIKLIRKRAKWPTLDYKEYQTLVKVYREGYNIAEAAKQLGCSRQTVSRRLTKIRKYYPDIVTEKKEFYVNPLPERFEDFVRQQF